MRILGASSNKSLLHSVNMYVNNCCYKGRLSLKTRLVELPCWIKRWLNSAQAQINKVLYLMSYINLGYMENSSAVKYRSASPIYLIFLVKKQALQIIITWSDGVIFHFQIALEVTIITTCINMHKYFWDQKYVPTIPIWLNISKQTA